MRRLLFIFLIVAGVIASLWWLLGYLTTGELSVLTPESQNTITLSETGKNPKIIKQVKGNLALSLKKGQYIISVQGNSVATGQVVNIKAHHKLNLSINPVATQGVEPVMDKNAYSVLADATRLTYADATNGELYQIDSQNRISQPFGSQSFRVVKWAASDYGVGQDNNGNLYIISNGQVTLLNNPGASDNKTSFAVSPNKDIYVAVKQTVFKYDSKQFKQIFKAGSSYPMLEAANSDLAVFNSADQNDSGTDSSPSLSVVGTSGSITKKIGTFFVSWSPDSSHLVMSGTSGAQILDSSLKPIATIPQNNISNVSWLDSKFVLYSVNDRLWLYDLALQKSQVIANMPLGATITGVSISSDHAYAYVSVQNNDVRSLKRVGLKGQTVNKVVFQLQDVLPKNLEDCSLSLLNFAEPTVLVTPSSSNLAQVCMKAANDELSQDGFDLSQLQIKPA